MTKFEQNQLTRFVETASAAGFHVRQQVVLAPYTTFKIGGPADLFVTVSRTDDLVRVANLARQQEIPFFVLGGGSNVLISDAGIRGLVILNRCRNVSFDEGDTPKTENERSLVVAESGAPLAGLARQVIQASFSGLEWAVSVPGTVGGAVVGNAGAHGGCIADNLVCVSILDGVGQLKQLFLRDLAYGYRTSVLKQHCDSDTPRPVVLTATFQLQHAERKLLELRAAQFLAQRRTTQPVESSAGSIFQNPAGDFAGRLIEAIGLKGTRIGGAQISSHHANFIVNTGNATANDVFSVIRLVQEQVRARLGVDLTTEILLIGDFAVN